MIRSIYMWTLRLGVASFVVACVDPIGFNSDKPEEIIILDGSITTEPGPYTITISRALPLDSDSTTNMPVTGASIVLHNAGGDSESFTEIAPGKYSTGGVIRGSVGSTYHITMTMGDGAKFESQPETILPAGEVKDVRYQYEARTIAKEFGKVTADVFNIFVDAAAVLQTETSYVRWRFTGTYVTETSPELRMTWLQGFHRYADPWPCSGYEFVDPGIMVQKRPCTCCRCWVTEYEQMPRLSDSELVEGGSFNNVKVAEVPITRQSFFEKYKVTIDQLTISRNAFEFFKLIRSQKEGATNLFQPSPGKIIGNIASVDSNYQVIGLFWAASVNRKSIYISETDVPYALPYDPITYPCDRLGNSTTQKPVDWND